MGKNVFVSSSFAYRRTTSQISYRSYLNIWNINYWWVTIKWVCNYLYNICKYNIWETNYSWIIYFVNRWNNAFYTKCPIITYRVRSDCVNLVWICSSEDYVRLGKWWNACWIKKLAWTNWAICLYYWICVKSKDICVGCSDRLISGTCCINYMRCCCWYICKTRFWR